MMVGMRPEEARDFYEEDEDPARVFARFDAAEKGRTAPPKRSPPQEPDLTPLRELIRELGTQLRQDLRKLRLRDRLALLLRHMTNAMGSRTKV
jgi:hypothetical protein